jgi:hypothetical protein
VAEALTQALEPAEDDLTAALDSSDPDRMPLPRPGPESAVVVPPRPSPAPEVVTRLLDRLAAFRRVAGRVSRRITRRNDLLLQTALAELGTFDEALRRVVQRSGGYEARFAGMTEDQAAARLRPAGRAQHVLRDLRPLNRMPEVAFSFDENGREIPADFRYAQRVFRVFLVVIVAEDAVRVALGIVELPAFAASRRTPPSPSKPRNRLTGIRMPRTSIQVLTSAAGR